MSDDGIFEGKLFVLKSNLNSLVLDVEGNNATPGAHVKTWTAKPIGENDNQLWYEDMLTGTIRTALGDLCLEVQGDNLVLSEFELGNSNQQWNFAGETIVNRDNPNLVLDIADGNSDCGGRVCSWEYNGGQNQHWTAEFMEPKFFLIRSQMSDDKVLDVEGASTDPGAHLVLYEHNGQNNQLFYEDRTGVIRSKLTKFALDGSGDNIKLEPYDPMNPAQQWVITGDHIALRDDQQKVLDIEDASSWDGTKICPWQRHGESNQCFTIQFV